MIDISSKDVYYVDENGEYPVVKKDDYGIRPAGKPDECFYCHSKVGEKHKKDCVVVCKKVKLKATIEFITDVPNDWDDEMINFKFNGSTWCVNNLIDDLHKWETNTEDDCLCNYTEIKLVEEK